MNFKSSMSVLIYFTMNINMYMSCPCLDCVQLVAKLMRSFTKEFGSEWIYSSIATTANWTTALILVGIATPPYEILYSIIDDRTHCMTS